MYNAFVFYRFKPEKLEEAKNIWQQGILGKIKEQPGFIRVQFYSKENGQAIALGSWETQEHAQAFMRTGVFADIKDSFGECLLEAPNPEEFKLDYFIEK